jgi:hypothetical protein
MNPDETMIVIRSLVPGGAAQLDGRLVPGDRLVSVNDTGVYSANLEQAVSALKGAPKGNVTIGVLKPLPIPEDKPDSDDEGITSNLLASLAMTPLTFPPPEPSPSRKGFSFEKLEMESDMYQRDNDGQNYLPVIEPHLMQPNYENFPTDDDEDLENNSTSYGQSFVLPSLSPLTLSPLAAKPNFSDDLEDSFSSRSVANAWGPPKVVEIIRKDGESLGISIVGGKVDSSSPPHEMQKAISGIFIKSVLPSSPADKTGMLKKGDRILEVDRTDIRDTTHDRAVDFIRKSKSPVRFLVQNLMDPTWVSVWIQSSQPPSPHQPHSGYPNDVQF